MTTTTRSPLARWATVLAAAVLAALNAPLAFLTLVQLWPRSGPHEWDAADEFSLLTWTGLAYAALVCGLTLLCVRLCRLRPWWYGLPLVLAALLLARQLVFPPYR